MFDGFEFKDHLVVDDDVRPVATVERGAVIDQWQIDLPCIGEAVLIELMTEAVFVGAFEQAGPSRVCTRIARPMMRWVRLSPSGMLMLGVCVRGCWEDMIGVERFIPG